MVVEDAGEKLPAFELAYLALGFVAPHLLIERVEELLTGSRAGEGGAVVQRSAEAAEIQQPFRRAVEGNAHAVEQVDDARRHFAHQLGRRLIGQKVAAVDGVVEVDPGGVAFALQVLGGVDAALRADRVGPLDWNDREQVNVAAHLGNFDGRGQSCQSATHNDDFRMSHRKTSN